MLNQNFLDEISQTLKIKGNEILKASCVVQLFPEDGALMQQMSVRSDLSVGAILQPDKDDYRNVWLLLPVTSSYGSSAKPVADLSIIKEYLEEFIICCKACFKAYEKRSSAYTLFNCASANSYISDNFYQAYMALQTQWNVECRGISQNYRECVVDVLESYSRPVKNKIIKYSKGLEYFFLEDFYSAIDYFTDVIKCNSNYAPAYFYRSRSYFKHKEFNYAIDDMMKTLQIAEQDSSAFTTVEDLHLADVYFDLGLLHSEINELEKAAEYYHKARPLLARLSVNSSKRKSDYQRLEMLIMSVDSRIQKVDNQKKYAQRPIYSQLKSEQEELEIWKTFVEYGLNTVKQKYPRYLVNRIIDFAQKEPIISESIPDELRIKIKKQWESSKAIDFAVKKISLVMGMVIFLIFVLVFFVLFI